MPKYYEAYEERYQKIHERGQLWFKNEPTPELLEWLAINKVPKDNEILEVGCGEGRDATHLAKLGYAITATDISDEAVKMCEKIAKENQLNLEVFKTDFVTSPQSNLHQFGWIYAIGTLHMLVDNADRKLFLNNLFNGLKKDGKLLLVNKGDGKTEHCTDKREAYNLVDRAHYSDHKTVKLVATSFCKKNWENHIKELESVGFKVLEYFNTINDIYDECMVVYLSK